MIIMPKKSSIKNQEKLRDYKFQINLAYLIFIIAGILAIYANIYFYILEYVKSKFIPLAILDICTLISALIIIFLYSLKINNHYAYLEKISGVKYKEAGFSELFSYRYPNIAKFIKPIFIFLTYSLLFIGLLYDTVNLTHLAELGRLSLTYTISVSILAILVLPVVLTKLFIRFKRIQSESGGYR